MIASKFMNAFIISRQGLNKEDLEHGLFLRRKFLIMKAKECFKNLMS
jgi:hypothetical protein